MLRDPGRRRVLDSLVACFEDWIELRFRRDNDANNSGVSASGTSNIRGRDDVGDTSTSLSRSEVAAATVLRALGDDKYGEPMRLAFDRMNWSPRPLLFYAVTSGALPLLTYVLMTQLGFAQYSCGAINYWYRPPVEEDEDEEGHGDKRTSKGASFEWWPDVSRDKFSVPGRRLPIVFCHGVGVGVLPYVSMLRSIAEKAGPKQPIFCPELPWIAMTGVGQVPSPRQCVEALCEMLDHWGYLPRDCSFAAGTPGAERIAAAGGAAHFVGHSFGTCVLTWVVNCAPHIVARLSILDPVVFLLFKADVTMNFLYDPPASLPTLLMRYFVAEEMHMAHTLMRRMVWNETILWPDVLPRIAGYGSRGDSVLVLFSGEDEIAPTHAANRMLAWAKRDLGLKVRMVLVCNLCQPLSLSLLPVADFTPTSKKGLRISWLEGASHGEFLARPSWVAEVVDHVISIHPEP